MQWFRDRRVRGRPPHPDVLTPAEWRVLAEVRRGRSNPETAQHLGLSLPTVKTHVSRMLAKLELADRHALAAWDGRPAVNPAPEPTSNARRRTTTAALALGGAAVAVAAVVLLFASMQGASAPAGPAAEEPPPLAGATETATPEVTAGPTAEATAEATPEPLLLPGMFLDPQPVEVVRTVTLPEPASAFATYDRDERAAPVVIYDFETGEVLDLGPGARGLFTADGRHYAWEGLSGTVTAGMNVINLETREPVELPGITRPHQLADFSVGGWLLEPSATGGMIEWSGVSVPAFTTYTLRDAATRDLMLEFSTANAAAHAGVGQIVLAAPSEQRDGVRTANIFLLDIDSREVEFVSTAELQLQMLLAADPASSLGTSATAICRKTDLAPCASTTARRARSSS